MSAAENSQTPPTAYLVPCDFTSAAHTELLSKQRVSCGWATGIDRWKVMAIQGNLGMYWLVIDDSLPEKDDLIKKHCDRYPHQATPIQDTTTELWGQQRTPSKTSFIPIGHIGLGRLQLEDERVVWMKDVQPPVCPTDVVTWIGPFYVSWVIQRLGIGKLALTEMERLAASSTVNGTIIALDAVAPDHALAPALVKGFYINHGKPVPIMTNHEWYIRHEYKPYHRKSTYPWTDPATGEDILLDTVYMQKRL